MSLKDSSNFVGHYTSMKVACEFILKDRQIRFSSLRSTNDPRENKERMIGVGWTGHHKPPAQERVSASEALKRAYLDFSKVFCGTVDAENPRGLNTKKCFGRPRMWAQYGDNHGGVCLVFDRAALDVEIRASVSTEASIYSDLVVYDDSLKSVSAVLNDLDYDRIREIDLEPALKEQVEKFHLGLFFRKDSDWISESEHRWVIHRWTDGYEYFGFGDSLRAIVLGVDCPCVYVPAIKVLALGAPVMQLEWDAEKEDYYYREL